MPNSETCKTVKELAEYFNVTTKTIYRLIEDNAVPYFRLGGSIRFKISDVEKYLYNKNNNMLECKEN